MDHTLPEKSDSFWEQLYRQQVGERDPFKQMILTSGELITFDKYIDFQESTYYVVMSHVNRMTLLVKLLNKSFSIREQERLKKQIKATQTTNNAETIEMDLFQINQTLKNEIGKDIDMVETFLQDSLKAIYIAIFQYI